MGLKVVRILVPVSDLNEAAAFYAKIFGPPEITSGADRIEFGSGETRVSCRLREKEKHEAAPVRVFLAADTDIEELFMRVKTVGVPGMSAIEKIERGERGFTWEDPFGNRFGFVEQV